MLSPKQARRALAKSRRQVWRMARRHLDPITVRNWRASIAHYATGTQAEICHGWLVQYARTDAEHAAVEAWEREYHARRRAVLAIEMQQQDAAWQRMREACNAR